ncbi:hypothetical protein HYV79_04195 [Candidatus Woesearchaeota archaeon]|nr:hypothetical protein [Candidatus Woesearchaeota archaeon]
MLLEWLKKACSLGLRSVSYTKREAEAVVRSLQKEGLLSAGEAKKLLGSVLCEARSESKRFEDFFKSEVSKEAKKAARLAKKVMKKTKLALTHKEAHKKKAAKKRKKRK